MKKPIEEIQVPKERQRSKVLGIEELASSLKTIGLINPITITEAGALIAGFRRLTAAKSLGWTEIEVRIFESLPKSQRMLIELEENIKRQDLHWKDTCKAILDYHRLLCSAHKGEWFQEHTAERAGFDQAWVSRRIAVAEALEQGDRHVEAADTFSAALNYLSRKTDRAVQSEIAQMDFFKDEAEEGKSESAKAPQASAPPKPRVRPAEEDILVADFIQMCQTYSGPKFNFLHCDFPYGVGMHKSDQADHGVWDTYEDTPEIYFTLIEAMCRGRARLMQPSAHLMFWFSMEYYRETLDLFAKLAPDLTLNKFPLIWHKSDGKGILPDPRRGPRRTTETAFLISRGDRQIVRPVASSIAAPTAKSTSGHISHKPEPVLRHFFQMFVDGVSEVLDPTCGSGGALNVAEEMGARRVQGWDLNPSHVEEARLRLKGGRNLRLLSKEVA